MGIGVEGGRAGWGEGHLYGVYEGDPVLIVDVVVDTQHILQHQHRVFAWDEGVGGVEGEGEG